MHQVTHRKMRPKQIHVASCPNQSPEHNWDFRQTRSLCDFQSSPQLLRLSWLALCRDSRSRKMRAKLSNSAFWGRKAFRRQLFARPWNRIKSYLIFITLGAFRWLTNSGSLYRLIWSTQRIIHFQTITHNACSRTDSIQMINIHLVADFYGCCWCTLCLHFHVYHRKATDRTAFY